MAIAFDTTVAGINWATASTHSYSHTCTGSDLTLYVAIFWGGGSDIVSGVTYNGVSMTRLFADLDDAQPGAGNSQAVYFLHAPATGSNTVEITLTGSNTISAISSSYTGTKQSGTPVYVTDDGVATSSSFTSSGVSVSTADSWLVAFFRDVDNRTMTSSQLTLRGGTTTVIEEAWDSNGTVSTGTQTVTYTISPSGRLHGHALIVLEPAPAGGGYRFVPQLNPFAGL